MAENASYNDKGSNLSVDFDSGSEESLLSCGGSSCCSEPATTSAHLKEAHNTKNGESQDMEARQAAQERMQEYKVRMMEFLMDRADAKIAIMEKQYQQQVTELHQASQPLNLQHIPSDQPATQPETFV